MKQTIYLSDFRDAFDRMRPNNFSYEGLEVLFEYLEDCERDIGEESELDVIALCCDFSEDTVTNIAGQYDIDIEGLDEDETREAVQEHLEDHGVLVGAVADGFVFHQF